MTLWTEDQQKVIASPAEKLICSAAAGSGKTAVMIERITKLIREGADPFSFLVITFTNAAAAEMRKKSAGVSLPSAGIRLLLQQRKRQERWRSARFMPSASI